MRCSFLIATNSKYENLLGNFPACVASACVASEVGRLNNALISFRCSFHIATTSKYEYNSPLVVAICLRNFPSDAFGTFQPASHQSLPACGAACSPHDVRVESRGRGSSLQVTVNSVCSAHLTHPPPRPPALPPALQFIVCRVCRRFSLIFDAAIDLPRGGKFGINI